MLLVIWHQLLCSLSVKVGPAYPHPTEIPNSQRSPFPLISSNFGSVVRAYLPAYAPYLCACYRVSGLAIHGLIGVAILKLRPLLAQVRLSCLSSLVSCRCACIVYPGPLFFSFLHRWFGVHSCLVLVPLTGRQAGKSLPRG